MTLDRFKIIFYIILAICVLTMLIAYTSFTFLEINPAVDWTMRYFSIPILVFMLPISYLVYTKLLEKHEAKQYETKFWKNVRRVFKVFILTVALTGVFCGTTLSAILLTNATGNTKAIHLHATVVEYWTTKNKGRSKHHIKIQDENLDRIVELKVKKSFSIGEMFEREAKIGRWGLLYSED